MSLPKSDEPLFCIGRHTLGPGHPTIIIAEMSGNHGGSLDRALAIVHAAHRAGADAIKLQTYTADTITLKSQLDDFCLPSDSPWSSHRTLWDLYREASTPWEWHPALFEEAHKLGMEIFSSPFDETAVDFLESLDAPCYKIASPEITHIPLLRRVAATGKPVIISTGISDLADIELALSTLRAAGSKCIMVLKCTTAYPSPPEESNLRTIADISSRFKVLSGLSDHTIGITGALTAVALGASLIEKHFTLDDSNETVDSFFSSGESEFRRLVDEVRLVEKLMGSVTYDVSPSAVPNLRGRRSIYVSADIVAGTVLSSENVKVVRPSFGLHPRYYDQVLGKPVKRDLRCGDRLGWEDI
jgi:pseudaminic acid synthase